MLIHDAVSARGVARAVSAGAALGILLSSSGCSDQRGGPFAYSPSNFGAPDAPKVVASESSYRIAPLDTLSIKVFKMADLSNDYEVDLAGRISMPLIGDVAVTELTTVQLDAELTRRLGEKYLENPDVSVSVKSSASRAVTVDGAVNKAGAIPVTGPVTLMQAVAQAGGATAEANLRRVAVFRQIGGRRHAAGFDLTSIRRGEMEDPQVYPGDIIIVDGSSNKALQKRILGTLPLLNIFMPF